MAKEPINLTEYGENQQVSWGEFALNMNVYSIENYHDLDEIGNLYHPDGQSDYIKNNLQPYMLASEIMFDSFFLYSDLVSGTPSSEGIDKF